MMWRSHHPESSCGAHFRGKLWRALSRQVVARTFAARTLSERTRHKSMPARTNGEEYTAYEQERDARKLANEAFLRELGLEKPIPPSKQKRKSVKKKTNTSADAPRRSDRFSGQETNYQSLGNSHTEDEEDDSDEDAPPKKKQRKTSKQKLEGASRRKSARTPKVVSYAENIDDDEYEDEEEEEMWLPPLPEQTETQSVLRFNMQAIHRVSEDVLPHFLHM
jgi:hypothetical protein